MTTPMTTSLLSSGDTVLGSFTPTPAFTLPSTYPTKPMALTAAARVPGSRVIKMGGKFYVRLPIPVSRMH